MNNDFNFLFVQPPQKNLTLDNYFIYSKNFPVNAQFEFSHQSAFTFLGEVEQSQFPSVILLDEAFGLKQNLNFISEYRSSFYLFNIDTLLFVTSQNDYKQSDKSKYPDNISGVLQMPLNKQVFMQQIVPHMAVYLV